ncbi:Spo0E family sporulation regulatory protein-aspartic acid phosphatase [Bacillus pinisoli]|uniref:Spo0E family sporulation regulatory protein-aspartic acid phosphatase n=1 Tax=Bacillus pinisoli TaxID=2901866 RepID=UPI001FF58649|nr:aspartyl-phosphate phosphatase Spo0E family protein [Bacillus pinisoli]
MRKEFLAEAIQVKRDEMIHIGITKGLRNEETIRCSQELDELLNLYCQITYSSCGDNRLIQN